LLSKKHTSNISKATSVCESIKVSSARQLHGFEFEDYIITKFGLTKSKSYTSEYDAYEKGVPVSIKYIKEKGSIDLGDYFRNANKKQDFIMYVGFWKL
jgi:hypothetical protein